MEDSVAGGHLVEYQYCKEMDVTLAVLREKGTGSTRMIGDSDSLTSPSIRFFEYEPETLKQTIREVVEWADQVAAQKRSHYAKTEPWRNP
jgi:hypothetical protein